MPITAKYSSVSFLQTEHSSTEPQCNVSIPEGCHNRLPQTGKLKATEIYFLTVGRPEVWNQSVSRALLPLEAPRIIILFGFLQFLMAPGVPWFYGSVQSLSRVRLFVSPWTAARQASMSITSSWSYGYITSIPSSIFTWSSSLCVSCLRTHDLGPIQVIQKILSRDP